MKFRQNFFRLSGLFLLLWVTKAYAQTLLPAQDLDFLRKLTLDVLESSRIYPGQQAVDWFGPNQTGGVLIRPGGRKAYPSFWIRDYAMSLETGLVPVEEQLHMLELTATTQCDQTWITEGGSMVPFGAIADHIRIDDGLPIYYPGTYNYQKQGIEKFGKMPPYGDQFFFIHMAWQYVEQSGDQNILSREFNGLSLMSRLEMAFGVPPAGENHLVYTDDHFRGVDFGFRDAETLTGYLCFPSILKYRASRELASLAMRLNQSKKAEKYREIARSIRGALADRFMDDRGMLKATTGKSQQADVWSTALAVYYNAMPDTARQKASFMLAKAYKNGTLAYRGNIRHILTTDDFNEKTAWEYSLSSKNKYQNGSYWGTPTGWVCYAIAQTDVRAARALAREYIEDLRATDYRKGPDFGGPYECFHPETGDLRNPVYLTSVSCPFAVFRKTETVQLNFQKTQLFDDFMAEGVAVADVNGDGNSDILAGSYWFEAPKWEPRAIREERIFDADSEWSDAFLHFAQDVDQDGKVDLIRIGFPGTEGAWYRNPGRRKGNWEVQLIDSIICNESPFIQDVDRDGRPELIFGKRPPGNMLMSNYTDGQWEQKILAGPQAPGTHRFSHGLGSGDLNQDGRTDVLVKDGWWEQPKNKGEWVFHPANFAPDCAQMYVYDVDRDGDQDVYASSAHNYGIWWVEQAVHEGETVWIRHTLYDRFSQTHGLALADMDGDGTPDLVTGKRYYAHNGKDPGGNEAAVLYVFLTRKDNAGVPYWVPVQIDDQSGVGLQVLALDVDGDGKNDIVSCNKNGLFFFRQLETNSEDN